METQMKKVLSIASAVAVAVGLSSCGGEKSAGVEPKLMTDALFAVMKADRVNYNQLIVTRMGPKGVGAVNPVEHWKDIDDGIPLPAQMFRLGSEKVAEMTDSFTYSLQSIWPVNKQNAPKTDVEEVGLQYVVDNPGMNYYGEETLGGQKYFTAVYPDVAVGAACVDCHNEHKDTPRTDFKLGDVMGGVVIRVPL
jgi:hypothetical protein